MLLLPKPQSPIIDSSNSLTKGLVFDASYWEGAGTSPRDTVDNLIGTFRNTPAWGKHFGGAHINTAGGTNKGVSYTTRAKVNGLVSLSVEMMIMRTGTGGLGYGVPLSKANGATRNWHFENDNGDAGWGHTFASYFTTGNRVWSIPYPTNNVWYHHVITYVFAVGTSAPTWYVNGVPATTTDRFNDTGGTGSPATDGTDLTIGNEQTLTQNWDGKIGYVRIWNRILTQAEARRLYENPWRIYRKPTRGAIQSITATTIRYITTRPAWLS